MSKSLEEIAKELKKSNKKVQLIYAFNGTGKTRLSRRFKELVVPKSISEDDDEQVEPARTKILYYSAFTEDLFYWDNDLDFDVKPKLKIQSNTFTDWLLWLLKEQGQDRNITTNFQRYSNSKLTPNFSPDFSEVDFSLESGNNQSLKNLKISKGEESNFIWSVFYSLLEQVFSELDIEDVMNRSTDAFNTLEYIFIDDPVSSLDENHLIELAVDLALLIKSAPQPLKFIVTTHNPLFYNVLLNEFNNKLYKRPDAEDRELIYKQNQFQNYRLSKNSDGSAELEELSNIIPFSYHLYLLSEIKNAIASDQIRKYHFNFLRNILEKTATFLGYKKWPDLLLKTVDGNPDPFANRIVNISSHSAHAGEETAEIEENDKEKLKQMVDYLINEYGFWKKEEE
ncbi:AAA family ATPase [Psychrobacter sp. LV10R520-6]|uniref:AAA family ATPase n=1 Tax=Psychrobacter sp. LV10R520-6 TaxID=1415574 RepID=UPI002AA0E24F|nr:AAA family ATPase [Psychrobacter sp. LV10R520-6]